MFLAINDLKIAADQVDAPSRQLAPGVIPTLCSDSGNSPLPHILEALEQAGQVPETRLPWD
jgi:hypothetical protein